MTYFQITKVFNKLYVSLSIAKILFIKTKRNKCFI